MTHDSNAVEALRQARPRARFVSASIALMGMALVGVWISGALPVADLLQPRNRSNALRFLGELVPHPIATSGWAWTVVADWLSDTLSGRFHAAVWPTLALSVFSVAVAGAAGAVLSVGASRRFARPDPWAPSDAAARGPARFGWAMIGVACRGLLLVLRSIPTYIYAFVLILVFGLGAWPAVFALVLHNTGILGRLSAEVIEDLEPGVPSAFRALGASRRQIAVLAVAPAAFGRFLLFFFVRWETAVREATVLGLLGFVSIGWFIADARARMQYDTMALFILLGSALIVLGDALSVVVRAQLRRATEGAAHGGRPR
jgi:phosphonate transport system permease protein